MTDHFIDLIQSVADAISLLRPIVSCCWVATATAFAEAGKIVLANLHKCNLPFCVYGAVAGMTALQAYLAARERRPHQAREHAMHGLSYAILAMFHFLG